MRDFRNIPIVDFAPFLSGRDDERRAVVERLGQVSRDVGFFFLTGHGVGEDLIQRLIEAAERFFALPLDRKMESYIGRSRNHRGYVPEGEEIFYGGTKDKKEAFDMSLELPATDPDYARPNTLVGPNQWPNLPGFAAVATRYYDATFGLGRSLLQAFAMVLGEPATAFDSFVTRPPSQLRLIHYPYDPDAVDVFGIGAHTDYELFTLLRCTAPGLEVLNDRGNWVDAPPVPGAYIVNIGDMLELLSNGTLVATSHRVRRTNCERYSFPLFFSFDSDTWVAPLERFVSPDRPRRPGLIAGEHIFAQTAQTFRYQRERQARGELVLPETSLDLSSFGQEARQGLTGHPSPAR